MIPAFTFGDLLRIWGDGGWVMFPLLILAVMLYTSAFQLLFFVLRGNLSRKNELFWREWVRDPSKGQGRAGEIIRYTQEDCTRAHQVRRRFDEVREAIIPVVKRRVLFVSMMVGAAPLMGLLGTVAGMLATFQGIAQSGGGDTVDVVAAGIKAALVTTQSGLMIALPGLFMAMIIRRRAHIIEASIARLEALTLSQDKYYQAKPAAA